MSEEKYKILGGDGQEYGPVSAAQIAEWIGENRVERKTPVFVEGARDWAFIENVPELAALFTQPPVLSGRGNGLNAIVPYKNVRALLAYYLAVFSLIPILGAPLGLLALVLGAAGLRFQRKNPAAGGVVHAWIGIVVGGFFGFVYLGLIAWLVVLNIKHH
jgi:hypothetical protein